MRQQSRQQFLLYLQHFYNFNKNCLNFAGKAMPFIRTAFAFHLHGFHIVKWLRIKYVLICIVLSNELSNALNKLCKLQFNPETEQHSPNEDISINSSYVNTFTCFINKWQTRFVRYFFKFAWNCHKNSTYWQFQSTTEGQGEVITPYSRYWFVRSK